MGGSRRWPTNANRRNRLPPVGSMLLLGLLLLAIFNLQHIAFVGRYERSHLTASAGIMPPLDVLYNKGPQALSRRVHVRQVQPFKANCVMRRHRGVLHPPGDATVSGLPFDLSRIHSAGFQEGAVG